ncbi:permease prefix domain 1-containing protein [Humibacter ginsenosidimutans]|uniref:DUF4153 domain-containing protein n=1 Tax=Humibacter ginsenosidimutans TaxID=2599293 RepID=A0A5B8M398_9MICO|nr:permease prefix domain 1-containing protein [Humibacter ginsenosidimutans]QDZ14429.1 hypothetical protein FPZ11_06340 [Humibacter ginsenosidimutans]
MDLVVERGIAEWRAELAARDAVSSADVRELESHLRDQVDALIAAGLAPDEALLVAVKRVGALDEVAAEYAKEHSDRLWKQLVVSQRTRATAQGTGLYWAIGLAIGAALAVKLPSLFGLTLFTPGDYYERNIALLVLPFLAAYFLVRRRASAGTVTAVAVPFVAMALVVDLYPFVEGSGTPSSQTELLAIIHSAVVLWLAIGIAHASGDWRSTRARMDFVRFTGEWIVYYVLIALGGAVLAGLTVAVFGAVGLNAIPFVGEWMLPCGAAGAVLVAAWLVEAKKNVIENIAPVLTRVFAPLVTLLLIASLVAALVQFDVVDGSRGLLIIIDVMLLVVTGLVLYAMSARDPDAPPSWFDRLQLVMLIAALAVDIVVLVAMVGRIGTYGASANKLASLGLNVILLVNLAGAAWLQLGFLRRRTRFALLEYWQMAYVPVYFVWALVVVVVFPPVFSFV